MKTSNSEVIEFDLEIAVIHARFFARRYSYIISEVNRLCLLGYNFFCRVPPYGNWNCFSGVPKIAANGMVVTGSLPHRDVSNRALIDALDTYLSDEKLDRMCLLFEVKGARRIIDDLGEVFL